MTFYTIILHVLIKQLKAIIINEKNAGNEREKS